MNKQTIHWMSAWRSSCVTAVSRASHLSLQPVVRCPCCSLLVKATLSHGATSRTNQCFFRYPNHMKVKVLQDVVTIIPGPHEILLCSPGLCEHVAIRELHLRGHRCYSWGGLSCCPARTRLCWPEQTALQPVTPDPHSLWPELPQGIFFLT